MVSQGGFIPPAFKSFLLFSILTFFTNVPYLIYQEKGILNNYETISAQSSSMINKLTHTFHNDGFKN